MTDTPTTASQAPQTPPAPRKRKRRWLRIVLVLLVLLIIGLGLLVAFLPTIASSPAVRSTVLSQANKLLAGKVDVANWDFNWGGGQTITGVKVYDDKQSLVLEIPKITTDASILDVLKGKSFGKLRIEGLNANIRRHPDGELNVAHIAKPDPDAQAKAPREKKEGLEEIEIPDIVGELEIVDARATLSGEPGVPPVQISGVNGLIKLPGGDAPIENKIDLTATVGDGPAGTISASGTLSAIKNGKLVLDTVDGQQTITVGGLDLGAATPLLGKDAAITSVKGKTDGNLVATLGGKEATVEGKFTIAGLAASGPALKGDTFASETTEILLPPTVVTMPNGPTDTDAMRVKTGSGPDQPVTITLQQGKATLFADASLKSILNVIDGVAPGDTGQAVVDANFDIGKLAGQMRNTFKLVEGVELTGGQLASRSTIDIKPDALALVSNTALTGVAGTNAGKPVQLQPIKLDLAATAGGGGNLLASIRDVKLDLASAFANGGFAGPSLAGINGKLAGTLDKVQSELGQVVDFGKVKLVGAFNVDVATKGDLTKTLTEPAELSAGLTVNNLNVSGLTEQPINEPEIQGNLVALVKTDANNAPQSIDVTRAFLRSGEATSPTVVADATARIALAEKSMDVPSFTVRQFAVHLPQLGDELGAIVPAVRNLTGKVNASLAGSASNVLNEPNVTLSQLRVDHSEGLFSVSSANAVPLTVAMPKGAKVPHASGSLDVTADLAKLNAQMKRLTGGQEVAVQTAAGDVRSGTFGGTLVLARAGAAATSVGGDFVASNLVLSTPTGQQQFQPLTIAFKASAADDLATATVDNASIAGDLLTASASNVRIMLVDTANPDAKVAPLKMLQSADVSLSVPNLAPVYTLANAFSATKEDRAAEAARPLVVTGGSFATKAKVSQGPEGLPVVNVSELTGQNIAVSKGTATYELASLAGNQHVAPNGDVLSPKGVITLKGLKLTDNGKPIFAEDQIDVTNDLAVDLAKSDATINAFSLKMVSSQALSLSAKGAVRDYAKTRKFDNLTADVEYDLAEVWKLAKPFVATDPESPLAKATMSGKVKRPFTVTGQLPANLPFHEAIKQVVATGSVAVPRAALDDKKTTLENFDLAFKLQDGQAALSMDKPAKFNDGALDLGGITIDLTDPNAPRLTVPANKQLVTRATLNPFLADKVVGKFINPAFTGAEQAKGLIDLKAIKVDRLALDAKALEGLATYADTGSAELSLSITDLELGGTAIQLIQLFDPRSQGFAGKVEDGRIRLNRGVVNSDITLQLSQNETIYPIRLAGNIGLQNFSLNPFVATIPTKFIQRLGGDLEKYMPPTIDVTLRGTSVKPEFRVDELIGKLVQDAAKKALADQVFGKAKDAAGVDDKGKAGDKPEDQIEDAIGDLLKGLSKDKKKK